MMTKSADDLRYYWNARLLPLLVPSITTWTQEDDETLLQHIVDQNIFEGTSLIQSTQEIDFNVLKSHTAE